MSRSPDTPPAAHNAADPNPSDSRGQPPHLSRERIIRSAIALLDAEGLAGLSMRRLADNLDAGAMSLYWYFSTKDELLKAATDTVLGEIQIENLADDWKAAVRAMATDLRRVIHRHPWLRLMLSSSPSIGPHGLAVIEAILLNLRKTGLSSLQLDVAVTTIFGYVLGLAVGENIWVHTIQGEGTGGVETPAGTLAQNPLLATFLADAAAFDPDQRFATSVDFLLASIEAGVLDNLTT